MTETFPADLVERVAAARYGAYHALGGGRRWKALGKGARQAWLSAAQDWLAAMSAVSPAVQALLQALLRGDAVAVPREPTDEMMHSGCGSGDGASWDTAATVWHAMLAASPYAEEPHGASVQTHKGDDK